MYDIIVFVACLAVGYVITNHMVTSLLVALVISAFYSHYLYNMGHPTHEGMKSGSGKSSKSKSRGKKTMKKYLKKRKFKKDTYNFDPDASLRETYKSLSKPDALGLNKDTKELIKTQQQLMGTLREMGPVLQQGKSIISSFDSFFKDGNTKKQDLAYMRSRLGLGESAETTSSPKISDKSKKSKKSDTPDPVDEFVTKPFD
jgi:hypothetical protein